MGDDHHAAGVVEQGALEDALGLHVEVVRRFVEDEEIRGLEQHAGQRDTGAFAAGEDSDFLEHVIAGEKEAAEDVAHLRGGVAGGDGLDSFQDGEVGIEFVGVVLREERGFYVVPKYDVSRIWGFLRGD